MDVSKCGTDFNQLGGKYKRRVGRGISLVVQQLRPCLPVLGVQVLSLIRQLRSHMPHGQKTPDHKTEAILSHIQ